MPNIGERGKIAEKTTYRKGPVGNIEKSGPAAGGNRMEKNGGGNANINGLSSPKRGSKK